MTTFHGSTIASGGYYLSTTTWTIEVVPREGGTLPGPASEGYLRVPFPLLFAVVPFIGLAFLIFLPFIGLALTGWALLRRATHHASAHAASLAATVAPDLATGAAHLTGTPGHEASAPAPEMSAEQAALRAEIERRRGEYPPE
jgi:hypothetical protein